MANYICQLQIRLSHNSLQNAKFNDNLQANPGLVLVISATASQKERSLHAFQELDKSVFLKPVIFVFFKHFTYAFFQRLEFYTNWHMTFQRFATFRTQFAALQHIALLLSACGLVIWVVTSRAFLTSFTGSVVWKCRYCWLKICANLGVL